MQTRVSGTTVRVASDATQSKNHGTKSSIVEEKQRHELSFRRRNENRPGTIINPRNRDNQRRLNVSKRSSAVGIKYTLFRSVKQ